LNNRTLNSSRNFIGASIYKVITLFLPFVIRTIFIRVIGVEYLGLNNLITSILQVLNVTELGFSTAVVFSMYKPIAEGDNNKISALMALYKKVYLYIGTAILIFGLMLIPFLRHLIKGAIPSDINLTIVYVIYLFNTSISYFVFSYKKSLLIAHQRNDIKSNINSGFILLQYLFQILVLTIFKNYYLFIILIPFFTIGNNLFTAYIVNKRYPQYSSKGKLDKLTIKELRKKIGGLMIFRIATVSRNSFDSIFISLYLGLTSVAIYNNYYFIIQTLTGLFGIVTISMSASIGNSIAVESIEKNYHDFKILNFIYMLISGFSTILLINLFQPFMLIWAGENLMLTNMTMVLISLYFYALKMGDIRGIYNDSAGLWWEQRFRTIIEAVCNVFLNWILIKTFGIIGIVFATLITILIFGFSYSSIITFKHYFGLDKIKTFFYEHIFYAVVMIITASIVYFINTLFIMENIYLDFLSKTIVSILITLLIYALIFAKSKRLKDSIVYLKIRFKNIYKKTNK